MGERPPSQLRWTTSTEGGERTPSHLRRMWSSEGSLSTSSLPTRMRLLTTDGSKQSLGDSRHSLPWQSSLGDSTSSPLKTSEGSSDQREEKLWLTGPRRGVAVTCAGVLLVTPDACLTRWMQSVGATTLAILFWKMLFLSGALYAYTFCQTSNWREAATLNPGLTLALATLQLCVTLGLNFGLLLTFAANALLAYSLDPIWGAVLGWVFLGDFLPAYTVAALVCSLGALVVMFLPAIVTQKSKSATSIVGDVLALGAGFSVAFFLTLLRWMFRRGKVVNAVAAAATGNFVGVLIVALVALVSGDALVPLRVTPLFYVVTVVDGCLVSCVIIAFTIGPKYITGAHVGMISLTETILGPLWVFAAFGERPPFFTLVGGAIVLAVILTHESIAIHQASLSLLVDDDDADTQSATHTPPAKVEVELSSSPAVAEDDEEEQKGSHVDV